MRCNIERHRTVPLHCDLSGPLFLIIVVCFSSLSTNLNSENSASHEISLPMHLIPRDILLIWHDCYHNLAEFIVILCRWDEAVIPDIYVYIIMTTPWPYRAKRILQDNSTKLTLSFYLSLLPSSCPSTYIREIRKHKHISYSNPPETTDQIKMHHYLRHQYQVTTFLGISACWPVPLRREYSIGMMHKLPSWLLVSSTPHYQNILTSSSRHCSAIDFGSRSVTVSLPTELLHSRILPRWGLNGLQDAGIVTTVWKRWDQLKNKVGLIGAF